jgi:excalibur calcium-binding domain-containing protein
VPASAAAPESYKNCTALNKDYPHGVGRSGARDKTSGKPVTTFRVSNTVYSYNDGAARHTGEYDLDRDNDGIACEKR